MTGVGLVANFAVDRGRFRLDLDLEVSPGTVTAIVGPNGAGKSTTLRALAGLLRPTAGRVELGSRVLDDAASGHHVIPARRGIGVVFQDYLLFPHLSALENVAFGLLARGAQRRDALSRAGAWLDRLGLREFASSRPGALSGGQAQRVALARALVTEPSLLLLDEPLAALDAGARLDVRADLAGRLRGYGGATVMVTHDPVDAIALADDMVVLDEGRIVQRGTPLDISRAPANEYVAGLVGLNLLRLAPDRTIVFSPSDVRVSAAPSANPPGSSVATWRCRVGGVEELGWRVRLHLARVRDGHRFFADLDSGTLATLRIGAGDDVWAELPFPD